MNHTIQTLIGVTLCGGQLCCKDRRSEPAESVDANVNHQESAFALLEMMGGRLPRENDVPFVSAPMNDDARIEVLLLHLKQAGISLAIPDSIDLGNGLWKIAPEDVERARAVVEKHRLKESLKDFHFEGISCDPKHSKGG